MRECEREGRRGKEEVKKQLGLVFPCPPRDFFEKKKLPKNKNHLHCMSYGEGEKTNKIIY